MTLNEISLIRLISQQIETPMATTVRELVGQMGAMQAQDFAMAKWAIGKRLRPTDDLEVERAIDRGEVVRTHLMRPTWHLVAAEDIYWMLELTAPQVKSTTRSYDQKLELTEALLAKSRKLILASLKDGNHLTREELMSIHEKAGIATDLNRPQHIMLRSELDGIVCNGARKGNKHTYALLSERVPKNQNITKEEALHRIAWKYFSSHGPATLKDFVWWSGLHVGDARNALEMIRTNLIAEKIGDETYWLTNSIGQLAEPENSVHLLPAFDEFLISYRDRSASIPQENFARAVSSNGIFRPIIVINGKVAGLWSKTTRNGKVTLATELFSPQGSSVKRAIEKEVEEFGKFLNKEIEIICN